MTRPDERPLVAGQTVTPGRYRCQECGHEHEVPDGVITNLPVCPRCQGDYWDPA
jgi:predicted nucleic acid-binding Zn ribbon protein